jgi:hypothetical protein
MLLCVLVAVLFGEYKKKQRGAERAFDWWCAMNPKAWVTPADFRQSIHSRIIKRNSPIQGHVVRGTETLFLAG